MTGQVVVSIPAETVMKSRGSWIIMDSSGGICPGNPA